MRYSNVLDYSLEAVNLDDVLQRAWGAQSDTHELALAMIQRVRLCQMRLVSMAWRNAGEQLHLNLADVKSIRTLFGPHTLM